MTHDMIQMTEDYIVFKLKNGIYDGQRNRLKFVRSMILKVMTTTCIYVYDAHMHKYIHLVIHQTTYLTMHL